MVLGLKCFELWQKSITIYDEYNTIHAVINYTYNANGYRTSKTITEGLNYKQNTYDLLGSNVIHEEIYTVINLVQATQDIYYTYDIDGTLVSFNLDSVDYFYINNIQGDIVAIVNQDGNVVVKYDYDSYGNIIQKNIDSGLENVYKANAYTYRGYRYDLETGLYYLQSRYYNPEIGRFISSDGLLGQKGDILSTNMYAYCANNPVMYIDPSGESFTLVLVILLSLIFVGTTVALVPEIVDVVKNNTSVSGYASPDPYAVGYEFLGVGSEAIYIADGKTCNLSGECTAYQGGSAHYGIFGLDYTNLGGNETVTASVSVIYFGFDKNDPFNFDAWSGGLSLGFSGGVPGVGSASGLIEIDIVGFFKDLFGGRT